MTSPGGEVNLGPTYPHLGCDDPESSRKDGDPPPTKQQEEMEEKKKKIGVFVAFCHSSARIGRAGLAAGTASRCRAAVPSCGHSRCGSTGVGLDPFQPCKCFLPRPSLPSCRACPTTGKGRGGKKKFAGSRLTDATTIAGRSLAPDDPDSHMIFTRLFFLLFSGSLEASPAAGRCARRNHIPPSRPPMLAASQVPISQVQSLAQSTPTGIARTSGLLSETRVPNLTYV